MKAPKPNPCDSCPYRADVPSGVWHESEYRKLPEYDRETMFQPTGVFLCHQQDETICAGWAAVHDMEESLALRLAVQAGRISETDYLATVDYTTPVELFDSGQLACDHGLREIEWPSRDAIRIGQKIRRKHSGNIPE